MSRVRDPHGIPRAGLEMVPLALLARIPLPGGAGVAGPSRVVCEASLGSIAVFGIYQALLCGLRTEALVRRGELDRRRQRRLVLASAWLAIQDGAAIGLTFRLLLLALPWLALPLGLLSVLGCGRASLDLAHAFWDGLSPAQRAELHRSAYAAGLNLHRLLAGIPAEDGAEARL